MNKMVKTKNTICRFSLTNIDPRYIAYNEFKSKLYKKLFSKEFSKHKILNENKENDFTYYKLMYENKNHDVLTEIPYKLFDCTYQEFIDFVKIKDLHEYVINEIKEGFKEKNNSKDIEKNYRMNIFKNFISFYQTDLIHLKDFELNNKFGLNHFKIGRYIELDRYPKLELCQRIEKGMNEWSE